MRVAEKHLEEVWDQGFTVVEGFLDHTTLKAARDALWEIYPEPEEYFADPSKHPEFARSQYSGIHFFPYPSWALNRVAVYPDLVDAAERFLTAKDIEIYKIELWAKYSGAINYDQPHHCDFGNHTLVVPRLDKRHTQMTTFILLSDVTAPQPSLCRSNTRGICRLRLASSPWANSSTRRCLRKHQRAASLSTRPMCSIALPSSARLSARASPCWLTSRHAAGAGRAR
jgi:hypothetical protein